MKKIILSIVLGVFGIGIIAFGIYGIKKGFTGKVTDTTELTVENRFGSVAELSTYEYTYTLVDTYKDANKIFDFKVPLTEKKVVIVGEGKIKVGFNLENVKPAVDQEKHLIRIDLPKPEVIENSLEIIKCIESNNILNPISVDETNQQLQKAKEKRLKEAEDKGIYEKAEEKAKEVIEAMYADMTEYKVEIN